MGGQDGKGKKLGAASLVGMGLILVALAVMMAVVSFRAQYEFIYAEKHDHISAVLEALGLDLAAVAFALGGLAMAYNGHSAIFLRALNLACVAGSIYMNAASAHLDSPTSVAVWVAPPLLYAALSDVFIGTVRKFVVGDRERGPLVAVMRSAMAVSLWSLRLAMAPRSTVRGFRSWVLTLPTGPGGRPVADRSDEMAVADDRPPVMAPVSVERVADDRPDTRPMAGQLESGHVADAVADDRSEPMTDGRSAKTSQTEKLADVRPMTDRTENEIKAAKLLADDPSIKSGAELARRLDVAPRTGQRLYNRLCPDTETA